MVLFISYKDTAFKDIVHISAIISMINTPKLFVPANWPNNCFFVVEILGLFTDGNNLFRYQSQSMYNSSCNVLMCKVHV